jgi:Flp pilus assembly protein TadG
MVVRRARGEDGAAAVEFALLLPVLLIILFGIIDFGRMYNTQITLTQAAREGVRQLALGNITDPTSATKAAAYPIKASDITVTWTSCPAVPQPTDSATVTATTAFSYVTPINSIFNLLGLSTLAAPTITGKGEMRCGG